MCHYEQGEVIFDAMTCFFLSSRLEPPFLLSQENTGAKWRDLIKIDFSASSKGTSVEMTVCGFAALGMTGGPYRDYTYLWHPKGTIRSTHDTLLYRLTGMPLSRRYCFICVIV